MSQFFKSPQTYKMCSKFWSFKQTQNWIGNFHSVSKPKTISSQHLNCDSDLESKKNNDLCYALDNRGEIKFKI
jgi:hypothetical protein